MDIEKEVKKLIKDKLEEKGFILDDVLYIKEDGNYYLRIIIDKNGIVDVEDCVEATKIIDPLVDKIDIKDSYILDVCSKEKGCWIWIVKNLKKHWNC